MIYTDEQVIEIRAIVNTLNGLLNCAQPSNKAWQTMLRAYLKTLSEYVEVPNARDHN